MKVAIIHYWLFHMRGGEKVIEALCEMFPQADIFTHVYDPRRISDTIRSHRVRTTFISRLPMARKYYKRYLPLMPSALEALDLSAYDLIISSEAGPAKGVIARADAVHICYCHSPMRYLWDQYHSYYATAGALERASMPILAPGLRQWDVTSAARVDYFVANSTTVADRIKKYWRRDAEIIAPPVDVDRFTPAAEREDFYLYVGELVPYKRADLAVAACTALNRRLIVIGAGPEEKALRRIAGPTIEFLGRAPNSVLDEFYASCRALIFPAEEDFGIVPVEAMASGAPVIAYGRGGIKDTVIDGETGVFFNEQTVSGVIEGIVRFEIAERDFDPARLREHVRRFHPDTFKGKMMNTVKRLCDARDQQLNRPRGRLAPVPSLVTSERRALDRSGAKL